MRNIILPAALALALGISGVSYAASTTSAGISTTPQSISDTVKSFDLSSHSITLNNGTTYTLPAGFKDPGLKVGSMVTLKYQMNGTAHKVDSLSLG
ncbi:DUF1344 domain-containing protein [Devosia rhodophyticola]|uniref:DUF1344 domain-containing protein n=1 Tax=Devosia rhodophyticola TaxID=3026423 RepID=A0ABY7YX36_9HYPH|nr:DUF1344 domain-containing protein [Devosia rhodophyticola]WDR05469.1 DUF1344 domain-containing protein [Devosia rhodophyticola]